MLYTKLSSDPGLLNNFTLGSYLYALRFYKNLLKKGVLKTSQIEFCGMLQLANNDKQKGIYESLKKMFSMQPELIQFLDADQASETCGVKVDYPGWYFPGSGWLSPKQLCQALAVNPNITVIKNTEVLSLNYRERWHVLAANPLKAMDSKDTDKQLSNANSNQKQLVSADVVIIANSYDANKFEQCQQLPMKTIRGQVTTIQSVRPFNAIKTVICHDGYITPEINGRQNIGATFTPGNDSIEVTKEDHQKNISSLFRTIPSLKGNNLRSDGEAYPVDSGKAGLRCMAPDYMPIVGQLHNKSAFLLDYAALTKDSHQQIDNAGQYYPGLYLNLAHGSRGLTSTPLCSELLAAQINRHPPPLDRDLINALNPARFVIRDLIKNRL